MELLDYIIGVVTIVTSAWILYVTIRSPERWTYQTDTSGMRKVGRIDSKFVVALFVIAATSFWALNT